MANKHPIDKEYLIATLKDFDKDILSKKYGSGTNITISEDDGNAIIKKDNGIYVPDISDDIMNIDQVIEKLTEKEYLKGFASEKYVTEQIDIHTEIMGDEIRSGYQKILDDDIEMGIFTANNIMADGNDTDVITFRKKADGTAGIMTIKAVYPNSECKGLEIKDGGVKLTAGKTYILNAGFSLQTKDFTYNTRVGYNIYDITHDKNIIMGNQVKYANSDLLSQDGDHQQINYPYTPEEDCCIAIKLNYTDNAELNITRSWLSIIEVKQPVMTKITVEDYAQLHGPSSQDTPIGNIISYMGTTPPVNYLFCDGTEYNITDYPELSNHFLKEFGEINHFGGDGVATFAVPDLKGEFLRGTGINSHVNQGSGSNVGIHQDGTIIGDSYSTDGSIYSSHRSFRECTDYSNSNAGERVMCNGITHSTYGGYFTTRPTNTSVQYCIKCKPTYVLNFENPVIRYSEDEHIVGFWIDGKVLYEKTIMIPGIYATVGWNYYPHNIENACMVFVECGFVYSSDNGVISCNNICNNQNWITDYTATSEDIRIKTGNTEEDITNSIGYFTIRYTKK